MNTLKTHLTARLNSVKDQSNQKVKIIYQPDTNSINQRTIQKIFSNKVIEKKYSSINISPKGHQTPISTTNKQNKKKPFVARSVKNLREENFNKAFLISDKKKVHFSLYAINEMQRGCNRENISKEMKYNNSKTNMRNLKVFNRRVSNEPVKKANMIFSSHKTNKTSIDNSFEPTTVKNQLIKKRNKPLANINIDIESLTELSNNNNDNDNDNSNNINNINNHSPKQKRKASIKKNQKEIKDIKRKFNVSNYNNIQPVNKTKKAHINNSASISNINININNMNNNFVTITTNSNRRNCENMRMRFSKDNTKSSNKLKNNLSTNFTRKSSNNTRNNKQNKSHSNNKKKSSNQISLKANLSGKINDKVIGFYPCINQTPSFINSLTVSKAYLSQNQITSLNSSYENPKEYSNRKVKLSINTLPINQNTINDKLQIKVNRKQLHNTVITSRYIKININNHSNSPPAKKETIKKEKKTPKVMTPKEFINKYHKYLTINEYEEIISLKDKVYYIGHISKRKEKKEYSTLNINKSFISQTRKKILNINNIDINNKHRTNSENDIYKKDEYNKCNYSIDENLNDKEGDYILLLGDHLNYRYEIISLLGKGSFGQAVKCFDHKTNEYVCIKIVKSSYKFIPQAKIESKLLEYIKKNEKSGESNIVKYYSTFTFRYHICLVFELLDKNLFEYIKSRDFVGLEIKKIKEFTKQILFCLLFLKKHNIIHCDLKPENILLLRDNTSKVKIIDFGSSCFDNEKVYAYIQSRFYRAPEVILDQGYGIEIDIWSLGCILCELFTGIPIFPGEDEREQLNYIMEYLDIPPKDYINISRKKNLFFDENNMPFQIPNSKGKIRQPKTKSFHNFLRGSSEEFVSFIKKCLKWDPENRITPEEGLMDVFICGDMNFEELYHHKKKIKRIILGIAKPNNSVSGYRNVRLARNYGKKDLSIDRYIVQSNMGKKDNNNYNNNFIGNCGSQRSSSKNLRRNKNGNRKRKELSLNNKVNHRKTFLFQI